MQISGEFIFLCIHRQQDPIVMTEHMKIFQIYIMFNPDLPSKIYSQEWKYEADIEDFFVTGGHPNYDKFYTIHTSLTSATGHSGTRAKI